MQLWKACVTKIFKVKRQWLSSVLMFNSRYKVSRYVISLQSYNKCSKHRQIVLRESIYHQPLLCTPYPSYLAAIQRIFSSHLTLYSICYKYIVCFIFDNVLFSKPYISVFRRVSFHQTIRWMCCERFLILTFIIAMEIAC